MNTAKKESPGNGLEADTRNNKSRLPRPLVTACLAALWFTGIDSLAGVLREPDTFLRPVEIGVMAAGAALLGFLVYWLMYAVIRLTIRRLGSEADPSSLAGGGSVAALSVIALSIFTDDPTFHAEKAPIGYGLLWVAAVPAAFLGAFGAVGVQRWLAGRPRPRAMADWINTFLPFAMILGAVYAWMRAMAQAFGMNFVYFDLGYAGLLVVLAIAAAAVTWFRFTSVFHIAVFGIVATISWANYFQAVDRPELADTQPADGSPNVILVVIDTLRADALSVNGNTRIETPNIDRFAENSINFVNAVVPSPWTTPTMTTMLSGVSPLVHQATQRLSAAPEELETLSETLANAGYRTMAVGKNPVIGPHVNLDQGFHEYSWYPTPELGVSLGSEALAFVLPWVFDVDPSTAQLVDKGLQPLVNHNHPGGRPFFLWLHIFDPHMPYEPPLKYLPNLQDNPPHPNIGLDMPFGAFKNIRLGQHVPGADEREWIRTLYEAEVRYVDDELGRFFQRLRDEGLYDDALIIVVSDHGEEFWEHEGFEHGHTFYQELLHVPLMVKLPGNTQAMTIDQPVSVSGVTPTVLKVAGVEHEPANYSDPPLDRFWLDPSAQSPPLYATGKLYYSDGEALLFGPYKYIHTFGRPRLDELYNLIDDPIELDSLIEVEPDTAARAKEIIGKRKLEAAELRKRLGLQEGSKTESEEEAREALESVGYL